MGSRKSLRGYYLLDAQEQGGKTNVLGQVCNVNQTQHTIPTIPGRNCRILALCVFDNAMSLALHVFLSSHCRGVDPNPKLPGCNSRLMAL